MKWINERYSIMITERCVMMLRWFMAAEVYNPRTRPWQTKPTTVFNALSMYQKGSIHKATELQW